MGGEGSEMGKDGAGFHKCFSLDAQNQHTHTQILGERKKQKSISPRDIFTHHKKLVCL